MLWFTVVRFFRCVAILGWGTPFCSVEVMLMKAPLFLALIPFQVVFQSIYFRVFALRSILAFSSSCSGDCRCLLMSFWEAFSSCRSHSANARASWSCSTFSIVSCFTLSGTFSLSWVFTLSLSVQSEICNSSLRNSVV